MNKVIDVQEARKILGGVGNTMTDQEIQNLITTFQILCESWLDRYETKILGRTVKEITQVS